MTRTKEPEVIEMAEALERFEQALLRYLGRLEAELAAEQAGANYSPLVKGLERQVAMLKALQTQVDEELFEQMLVVANMSQSLTHRRTRRFF